MLIHGFEQHDRIIVAVTLCVFSKRRGTNCVRRGNSGVNVKRYHRITHVFFVRKLPDIVSDPQELRRFGPPPLFDSFIGWDSLDLVRFRIHVRYLTLTEPLPQPRMVPSDHNAVSNDGVKY